MTTRTPTRESVAQVVRERWRAAMAESDGSFSNRTLSEQIARELREDPAFMALFAETYLVTAVMEIGNKMLRADREKFREIGGEVTTVAALKQEIAEELKTERVRAWTFWEWKEFDPETGLRVALPAMTKAQLLRASVYRQEQADTNAFEARFLRLVADMLAEDERVKDVLSDEQLVELRRHVEQSTRVKDPIGQVPAVTEAAD